MGHTIQKHIIILRFEHEFGAVLRTKSKTAMKWVDPIPIFHRFPISMAILLVIQRHAPKPRSQAHVREQRASECRDLRRCGDLGTGNGQIYPVVQRAVIAQPSQRSAGVNR